MTLPLTEEEIQSALEVLEFPPNEFDEFCTQVEFKKVTHIDGYSSKTISFTYTPFKLGSIFMECTMFFDNQEFTDPIKLVIKG